MTLFDPFAVAADPFPAFAAARAAGGALPGLPPFPGPTGALYLFSHRHCLAALKHPALLQAPPGAYQAIRLSLVAERVLALFTQSLLLADPPRHAPLRRLLSPPLSPGRTDALAQWLRGAANARVEALARLGRFDALRDLAAPLAVATVERLLGMALPVPDRLKAQVRVVTAALDLRQAALPPSVNEACARLEAMFAAGLAGPLRPDGMAAALVAERDAGRLTHDEVLANLLLMVTAGQETLVDAFGNALSLLADAPEQRRLLESGQVAWTVAADELLRLGTSVIYAGMRVAADDLTIGDLTVPAGSSVVAVVASASRDESFAPAGDRLDLRAPRAGLTFGSGPHVCLGQHLARLEMAALLEALCTRAPGWTLDRARLARRPMVGFRGLAAVPVRVPHA